MRAAYRAQRGRELALCERHDDSDSSVARCDEWCKYPAHCDFCKCRACSLCKPCSSKEPNDLAYEGCEEWCSAPEHCERLRIKPLSSHQVDVPAHASPLTCLARASPRPQAPTASAALAPSARHARRLTQPTRLTRTRSPGAPRRSTARIASARAAHAANRRALRITRTTTTSPRASRGVRSRVIIARSKLWRRAKQTHRIAHDSSTTHLVRSPAPPFPDLLLYARTQTVANAKGVTCAESGACHGARKRATAVPRLAAAVVSARGMRRSSRANRGAQRPTAALTRARGASCAYRTLASASHAIRARRTTVRSRTAPAGALKATLPSTASSVRAVRAHTVDTPAAKSVRQAKLAPRRAPMTRPLCAVSSFVARRIWISIATCASAKRAALAPRASTPSSPARFTQRASALQPPLTDPRSASVTHRLSSVSHFVPWPTPLRTARCVNARRVPSALTILMRPPRPREPEDGSLCWV